MTTTTPTTVNGVDTAALLTTREAVRLNPELAQFQFRATNSLISGTHTRSTIDGYFGADSSCSGETAAV